MSSTSFTRLQIWEHVVNETNDLRLDKAYEFVADTLVKGIATHEWKKQVRAILSNLLHKCQERWIIANRKSERFRTKYKEWLSQRICFPAPSLCQEKTESEKSAGGRPKAEFDDLSVGRKRQRTSELRASIGTAEINFAAQMKLREAGNAEAATIVQKVVEASPRTLHVIYAFIKEKVIKKVDDAPLNFTVEEALAYKHQCNLSREQYLCTRMAFSEHNCKVLPPYEHLSKYKKENCFPAGITITERKGSVSLQSLLDHIATRTVMAQQEVIKSALHTTQQFELVSKIGFDASTRHSRFNQRWKEAGCDDDSMLLTSLAPLLLHQKDSTNGNDTVVWMNRRPSSTTFCRPVELEYTKESVPTIKTKMKNLEESIKSLEVTIVLTGDGQAIEVVHTVLPTMVDGKVSSAATNTAAQTCKVCHATPKDMNKINLSLESEEKWDTSVYKYGLSVLHANIRFLDYMLNIAYRLDVRKAYCKYTPAENKSMEERKSNVKKRFKEELGLLIDSPSTSGGTTNTGNNSRRFFDESIKAAEITGLNLDVLKRCKVVLRTLSCGYAINIDAFKKYSLDTARLIVNEYPFYYMPSAVHTVLLHGFAYIEYFPVPIGMLSEEALESEHKQIRSLRTSFSRKTSRESTMHDIFCGLMERTDPVIASLKKAPKSKGQLDSDVLRLLIGPGEDGRFHSSAEPLIEEEESDVDE